MDGTIQAQTALQGASITSAKIVPGAILNKHIANNTIVEILPMGHFPGKKITADPIPSNLIADNSISGEKLRIIVSPALKLKMAVSLQLNLQIVQYQQMHWLEHWP